jgi:diguanylate cyclase (GGDEF)-like protein
MMQNAIPTKLPSLEWGQAKLRLLYTGFALMFFATAGLSGVPDLPHWGLGAGIAAGFLVTSTAWAWWIWHRPGDFPLRRASAALADNLMVSGAAYLGGPLGVVFYPFFLQSIVGHGMRFGIRSLRVASTSAAVGFGVVILASDHWRERPVVAVALWCGLLILPLSYYRLLERLRDAKSALERELNQTVYAATHDSLTDLANRGYFVQRLDELIDSSQRCGEGFALLYLDLDGFKPINDAFGHAAGDRVLVEVAAVLRHCARRPDLSARLGGDEFAVLVRHVTNEEVLDKLVRRLLIGILEVGRGLPGAPALSASVGISLYPVHGTVAGDLLSVADSAMYRAKREGRGRWCPAGRDSSAHMALGRCGPAESDGLVVRRPGEHGPDTSLRGAMG